MHTYWSPSTHSGVRAGIGTVVHHCALFDASEGSRRGARTRLPFRVVSARRAGQR